jgi:hypothetical protein
MYLTNKLKELQAKSLDLESGESGVTKREAIAETMHSYGEFILADRDK